MKKSINKFVIVLASAAMLTACGNKTAKTENTADSLKTDTVSAVKEAPAAEEKAEGNILTAKGMGAITIGMSFDAVPAKIEGLYTKKEVESNDDFEGVFLNNDKGESVISLEGEGKVDRILVMGGDVKTAQGICIGMPVKDVKAIKGIEKVKTDPQADFQQESYKIDGVTIWIDSFVGKGDVVSQMSVED